MKERSLGIFGRKLGMTQIFGADGHAMGVTVLELGPNLILGKRTKGQNANQRTDNYSALRLGFDPKPVRKVKKAEAGTLKAVGGAEKATRMVREMRVKDEIAAKFEVGQNLTLKDVSFKIGDLIDVTATSIGKGFQGVIKRHHMHGFPASHGTHEYFRHGGSIGNRKWPGRVFKGRGMPGHMGNERVTTQNIKVALVKEDENLLLIHGAVPGHKGTYVLVRPAIKSHP